MKTKTILAALCVLVCSSAIALAQTNAAPDDATATARNLMDKAEAYLKTQQKPDGGWQDPKKDMPAITAIVLRAFVQDPVKFSAKDEFLHKGFDKLLSYQVESGGIYQDALANYNTAIAISALSAANDPAFKDRIDKAVAYLKGLQWTKEKEGTPATKAKFIDQWYGGWGYGGPGRPDLSNVQMAMQALHDAGLKPDDPAFKAAAKFITRQQNLSETNDQPWASNDGGFVYGPGADGKGESMAGVYTTADGQRRLRSYGSMTYAGLKSFIYAGVSKDDPRVKAAFEWVRKNWSTDENPGMRDANPEWAHAGLYYYYMTMAKALHAYGQPIIESTDGQKHDWRKELIAALAQRQKPDGSWVGEARWMESNPILVTSYAILALEDATADLKDSP